MPLIVGVVADRVGDGSVVLELVREVADGEAEVVEALKVDGWVALAVEGVDVYLDVNGTSPSIGFQSYFSKEIC